MPAGKSITKIVVLGAKSVGKTSIIEQLVFANYYPDKEMHPTIEDTYDAWIEVDRGNAAGTKERIRIYDIKGQDSDNPEMPMHHMHIADGFILVFSVTCKKSFDLIKVLKKEVESCRGKDFPMVLIGTKVDSDARDCDHAASSKWAKDEKLKFFEVTTISRPTLQKPLSELVKKATPNVVKPKPNHMNRFPFRLEKRSAKENISSPTES